MPRRPGLRDLSRLQLDDRIGTGSPAHARAGGDGAHRGLIGDARCDDNAECRSVALGQRACGGPESYLAWSSRRTDAATLERAVAEFAAASRPARPGDALSTCEVLRDPGAFCARDAARPGTAGRCRLRPARGPEALPKL